MTNELKIKPMNMLLGLNNAEMEIENVVVDFQGTPTGQTTSKRYNFTDAAKMNERFDKLSEDQKKNLKHVHRTLWNHENAFDQKPLFMEEEEKVAEKIIKDKKLNKIKAKKSAGDIVKLIDETVKKNIKPTDIESVSVVVKKPKPFDWRLAPWQDYPQDDDVPAPRPDDEPKGLESFRKTIGKQLRAENSKRDWERTKQTIYKDNSDV
jgi:hypothetical protein